MLERVAVHQTRLRVPGVGLDARGVVLGSRGLVLLPSLDRLVTFLALYTEEQGLEPLLGGLRIEVVRSKLGAREVVLGFEASSSDRMDRVAEVSRLAGGFVFTGTSRHFVQYRDAAAPFGFDAPKILQEKSNLILYHTRFTQGYEVERELGLLALLSRMEVFPQHGERFAGGECWVVAEAGLGPQLAGYLARSGVDARAGVAEWPPPSALDDSPVRRWLFHVEALPARLVGMLMSTPGIAAYRPEAPGVAVQVGFRHPVSLRACPVFPADGLTLFRGAREPPLVLGRRPQMAELARFTRAELIPESLAVARDAGPVPEVSLGIRLLPGSRLPSAVEATLVPTSELQMLRRLAYAMTRTSLQRTRIALTELGAFLLCEGSVDSVPLGQFFRRVHSRVFVPLGMELAPRVSPPTLFRSLGAPSEQLLFFLNDGRAVGIAEAAFGALEAALAAGSEWAPLPARTFAPLLELELPKLWYGSTGALPLSRAAEAAEDEA